MWHMFACPACLSPEGHSFILSLKCFWAATEKWTLKFAKSSLAVCERLPAWKLLQNLMSSSVDHGRKPLTDMDECMWLYADGPAHPELCSALSGLRINAPLMLQNHHWAWLELRPASGHWNYSLAWQRAPLAFSLRSRGAWISLLVLMMAIRQIAIIETCNLWGQFWFGIKGCVSSFEQKHHRGVWPGPLGHSCPLIGWNSPVVRGPGWLTTASVFLGAFWDRGARWQGSSLSSWEEEVIVSGVTFKSRNAF